MKAEHLRSAAAHLHEAEAIAIKIDSSPNCKHISGWREDLLAELREANRLMQLGDKPDPDAELLQAAA